MHVQTFSTSEKKPTPELVRSEYFSLSLNDRDLTHGRVNIFALSVNRRYISDDASKGLETKSGVCGCCDVLNQRWLILVQDILILQFVDKTLIMVYKWRCIEKLCVYNL